jgi:hypothetical protein
VLRLLGASPEIVRSIQSSQASFRFEHGIANYGFDNGVSNGFVQQRVVRCQHAPVTCWYEQGRMLATHRTRQHRHHLIPKNAPALPSATA